jgi:hypothetical protein
VRKSGGGHVEGDFELVHEVSGACRTAAPVGNDLHSGPDDGTTGGEIAARRGNAVNDGIVARSTVGSFTTAIIVKTAALIGTTTIGRNTLKQTKQELELNERAERWKVTNPDTVVDTVLFGDPFVRAPAGT